MPVGVGTLAHSPGSLSVGRDARIDAAKGLGIFLVVLGHAKGLPEWWVVLIYSFHVPLFFCYLVGLLARIRVTLDSANFCCT